MGAYPKCKHFKASMVVCSLVGSFPWQFMFESNKSLQKTYAIYSRIFFGYYLVYLLKVFIKLYVTLYEGNIKMDDLSALVSIVLICSTTFYRQWIILFRPAFRNIVKYIIDRENRIISANDQELLDIYNECVHNTHNRTKYYLYVFCALTTQYIIGPMISEPKYRQVGNETVLLKRFPVPRWFPFDEQTHYLPAFLWDFVDCLVAGCYITCTDIIMICLIVYPSGQLKMLQHRLRNFHIYQNRYKNVGDIEDENSSARRVFADVINSHKEIIWYVDSFNNAMSSVNLFDFLQSSLQIAFMLNQVTGQKVTIVQIFCVATFFVSMISRLLLYYYYANEVITLSKGLALSVWESNWYEQPKAVQLRLLFFIMRTQKALVFQIGPFSVMSLSSIFAILKATYSYLTLIYAANK